MEVPTEVRLVTSRDDIFDTEAMGGYVLLARRARAPPDSRDMGILARPPDRGPDLGLRIVMVRSLWPQAFGP